MSRVVIRTLRDPREFAQVQDVAREAWGFSDRQLPAVTDLMAVGHAGGLTAAAYEGRTMLGFVHGLPRTNLDQPSHHSHMLAVRPAAQGRGLSTRLKLFQRRWCLARGIKLVTWTYDPLLVRNAQLNLVRLQARACGYIRDFYGPLGGIYRGLPTDRFEVHWRLDHPRVRAAARGRLPHPPTLERWPRTGNGAPPAAPRTAVAIPLGAPALYASDPAAARRARLALRRAASRLFARGYEATALSVGDGFALYGFERP